MTWPTPIPKAYKDGVETEVHYCVADEKELAPNKAYALKKRLVTMILNAYTDGRAAGIKLAKSKPNPNKTSKI